MKKPKAVKKSGKRAASIAGKWSQMKYSEQKWEIASAVSSYVIGNLEPLESLISQIDTMAASVLSQVEYSGDDKKGKVK